MLDAAHALRCECEFRHRDVIQREHATAPAWMAPRPRHAAVTPRFAVSRGPRPLLVTGGLGPVLFRRRHRHDGNERRLPPY